MHKCLDSLINQTLETIEIICVNDGSTDACPQILDTCAKKDTRIQVIHKQNAGLFFARKDGVLSASGKYLMFVDSDDWLSPEACADLYALMEKHQTDILHFSSHMFDACTGKNIENLLFFDPCPQKLSKIAINETCFIKEKFGWTL